MNDENRSEFIRARVSRRTKDEFEEICRWAKRRPNR